MTCRNEEAVRDALSRVIILGIDSARISDVREVMAHLSRMGKFQLMDGRYILGEDHVRFACFEALRSFQNQSNVTNSLSMEVLVKAACTTQITEAIKTLGVKEGLEEVVLVGFDVDAETAGRAVQLLGGQVSGRLFLPTAQKRKRIREAFDLTEPVEKALLERIALSSVI